MTSFRSVRVDQATIESQLVELGVPELGRRGDVEGAMQFASLRSPCDSGIYFLDGGRRLPERVKNSLILVGEGYSAGEDSNAYIRIKNPQLAFYMLMRMNNPPVKETGVHKTALISPGVLVTDDSFIGPYCVIEAGVQLGSGCHLDSHVVVKQGSSLGERVSIEPHCTIGATGVAWVWREDTGERVIQPQTGGVRIEDDVFIGSDVAIVRGSVNEDSVIGSGTVIAHGSKIGHGCRVGRHCHLANNVTLAGNVDVGDRAFIGSGAVVRPQAKIADGVVIGAGSVVVHDIDESDSVVYGNPARYAEQSKGRLNGVPIQSPRREQP